MPKVGVYGKAQADAAIAVHAALTATHGVAIAIADTDDITTHAADSDAHHTDLAALEFIIDGAGSAITTGEKGHLQVPFACTILECRLVADQTGSIVVDIWKAPYAGFPPDNGDSITASAVPTISSGTKYTDATLTGWTTAVAAGDILAFNVDSCTTITRCTVVLKVRKG